MTTPPETLVPELPPEPDVDWSRLPALFAGSPQWEFSQPWRADGPEPAFRPGGVRLGWRGDRLCYLAELTDAHVASRSDRNNLPLWELGDVLEVFAGVAGAPGYAECHVAPTGCTLQLRWPTDESVRNVRGTATVLTQFAVDGPFRARVRTTPTGWMAYAELPAASVPSADPALRGQTWHLNFGRYDEPAAHAAPVISCTAPLRAPAFHRRPEWRAAHFV